MTFDCATYATAVLPGLVLLVAACLLLIQWGLTHRANAAKAQRDLIWVTDEWKKRAHEAEEQVTKLAARVLQMERERAKP